MKTRRLRFLAVAVSAWLLWSQSAVGGTFEIRHSIGLPSHTDFATDVTWDGQYLWTSVYMSLGSELLRTVQLRPTDGSVVSSIPSGGDVNRSGIAWDGSHLWVASCLSSGESGPPGSPPDVFADLLREFHRGGTLVETFAPPHAPDAQTTGMAWDGESLWFSDWKHEDITQVDPNDMSVISSFPLPGPGPGGSGGLTWDGNSLWSVDLVAGVIYQLDRSGNLLQTWPSPTPNPCGITFDGDRFWILDNDWKAIVQVTAIPEPSTLVLAALAPTSLLLLAGRRRSVARGYSSSLPGVACCSHSFGGRSSHEKDDSCRALHVSGRLDMLRPDGMRWHADSRS